MDVWEFYLVNLSLHHDHGVVVLGERQGNYKQELTIQIEWRQIWYLCFTYQNQMVLKRLISFLQLSYLVWQ